MISINLIWSVLIESVLNLTSCARAKSDIAENEKQKVINKVEEFRAQMAAMANAQYDEDEYEEEEGDYFDVRNEEKINQNRFNEEDNVIHDNNKTYEDGKRDGEVGELDMTIGRETIDQYDAIYNISFDQYKRKAVGSTTNANVLAAEEDTRSMEEESELPVKRAAFFGTNRRSYHLRKYGEGEE